MTDIDDDLLDESDVPDVEDLPLLRSIDNSRGLLAPPPTTRDHPAPSAPERVPPTAPAPPPSGDHVLPPGYYQRRPAPAAAPLPSGSGLPAPTARVAGPQIDPSDEAFWGLVDELRRTVAERVSKRTELAPGGDAQRGVGMHIIGETVRDHAEGLLRDGASTWDEGFQHQLRQALFAAQFGLGRLQPYVDDENIENIEGYGHQKVDLVRVTGGVERVGPIARSNEDLQDFLRTVATRYGHPFTPARPQLFVALPGKVRLTAVGYGHTPEDKTYFFLRMQRLKDISLDRLVDVDEIDTVMRDFLRAAVRANRTIVVSGQGQGSGKTSMVKALALEIPKHEHLVTVESDFELYLDEVRERTHPLRALPPSGEDLSYIPSTGDLTGLFLRANADRLIVGEARTADEVDALVRAMQSGMGTLTTLHADSANDVIEVLATLVGTRFGSIEIARRQAVKMVHLIVYLGVSIDPDSGRRYRYVREILEVEPGDNGEGATQHIFAPGPDHRAVPTGTISQGLRERLAMVGYDATPLMTYRGTGTWSRS